MTTLLGLPSGLPDWELIKDATSNLRKSIDLSSLRSSLRSSLDLSELAASLRGHSYSEIGTDSLAVQGALKASSSFLSLASSFNIAGSLASSLGGNRISQQHIKLEEIFSDVTDMESDDEIADEEETGDVGKAPLEVAQTAVKQAADKEIPAVNLDKFSFEERLAVEQKLAKIDTAPLFSYDSFVKLVEQGQKKAKQDLKDKGVNGLTALSNELANGGYSPVQEKVDFDQMKELFEKCIARALRNKDYVFAKDLRLKYAAFLLNHAVRCQSITDVLQGMMVEDTWRGLRLGTLFVKSTIEKMKIESEIKRLQTSLDSEIMTAEKRTESRARLRTLTTEKTALGKRIEANKQMFKEEKPSKDTIYFRSEVYRKNFQEKVSEAIASAHKK